MTRRRKFILQEAGAVLDFGAFECEGETKDLPDGWRELVEAADTDTTFTLEVGGKRYLSVSVKEIIPDAL